MLEALSENRISLTVAGRLAPHLRDGNVDGLLARCAGMTKRQVEDVIVELAPKEPFKPSIRKRPQASSRNSEVPNSEPSRSETPSRRAAVEPATLEVTVNKAEPNTTVESFYSVRTELLGDYYRLVRHEVLEDVGAISTLYSVETQLASEFGVALGRSQPCEDFPTVALGEQLG